MPQNYRTATNGLIALNIIVFFLTEMTQQTTGLELYFYQNRQFYPWQMVTYLFMHANIYHLLFNMFGLWMFGSWLERLWGAKRFIVFYLLTGIGAAVIYMAYSYWQFNQAMSLAMQSGISAEQLLAAFNAEQYFRNIPASADAVNIFNTPMVGASGAIYGVLVAFAWLFPNFKMMFIFLPVPVAAKYFVPGLLMLDLFLGVTGFSLFGANVAHFAHIGGAIIAVLFMLFWSDREAELVQRFR